MKIDKDEALRVFEEEAASEATIPSEWRIRVERLSAASSANKTFIAVLGTALLAKAVDPTVDPFSLKGGTGPKGYSARSLCKDVLAANAPRLKIDLGVKGREPLNNQPFFAEDYISEDLPVKNAGREPLRLLLESLRALDAIKEPRAARAALRAFLRCRRAEFSAHEIGDKAGDALTEAALLRAIRAFVSENSESGKRAQAVAAGLLDTEFGTDRVVVGKVFDPSRHFPGDVVVRGEPLQATAGPFLELRDDRAQDNDTPAHSLCYEVRDKPVTANDLYHFTHRAMDHGVKRVVMLAVAHQHPLGEEQNDAIAWAAERGVRLYVYLDWERFVRDTMFRAQEGATPGAAYRAIFQRLSDLEVSPQGVNLWESLGE
ncbi:restriction endonuclease, SacI family [Corallococcus exiguus]|uniref:restriction endonuclease, SacI family n=1 Tax=Corallococcus exiguus TaxID=83462 RepID=UPI001A8CD50B|nr:restriction endonuclease, SacI family [Corallococcus exiguus]